MQITDVRVRKVLSGGKLKAVAVVTFDDEFVVHDIKVIDGNKGLFVAMPSRKMQDGEYRDIAHPINQQMRDTLSDYVLQAYDQVLSEEGMAQEEEPQPLEA
ncbi:septation regulator SpoVG [Eubacteriales bacterium OttesenSCG-928-N14]|nr:septation regulator SpoVG [Eubacteriales bacterium OttesenSCG-928-N14]